MVDMSCLTFQAIAMKICKTCLCFKFVFYSIRTQNHLSVLLSGYFAFNIKENIKKGLPYSGIATVNEAFVPGLIVTALT